MVVPLSSLLSSLSKDHCLCRHYRCLVGVTLYPTSPWMKLCRWPSCLVYSYVIPPRQRKEEPGQLACCCAPGWGMSLRQTCKERVNLGRVEVG